MEGKGGAHARIEHAFHTGAASVRRGEDEGGADAWDRLVSRGEGGGVGAALMRLARDWAGLRRRPKRRGDGAELGRCGRKEENRGPRGRGKTSWAERIGEGAGRKQEAGPVSRKNPFLFI
jgi:hypothetical protein